MKYSNIVAAVTAFLLSSSQTYSTTELQAEQLQVMLQGGTAPELRALVEAQGGAVTHDLHIIDAVGATLTQAQLDEVLKSSLVTRHISDLSAAPPDKEPDTACEVGGALELDFNQTGFRWTLYNKRKEPATLESLDLAWPKSLGTIKKISVGGTDISPSLYNNTGTGALNLQFSKSKAPALRKKTDRDQVGEKIRGIVARRQGNHQHHQFGHHHDRDHGLGTTEIGKPGLFLYRFHGPILTCITLTGCLRWRSLAFMTRHRCCTIIGLQWRRSKSILRRAIYVEDSTSTDFTTKSVCDSTGGHGCTCAAQLSDPEYDGFACI